ncbi:MAG: succinate--CoA ligase subunit alpha [Elusimicrobia bacterium]|nr:succinate--CoA ligase subunit alpha [Elusimicrobiota bacterium]
MSILVHADSRVVIQGITGSAGSFHAQGCLEYGTKVVAGVTPGKGGSEILGVPVFDSVRQAVKGRHAEVSLIFVPAPHAADAIVEAAEADVKLIVCITEGIPVLDMVGVKRRLAQLPGPVVLIGPNCPGVITPGACKVGIMPGYIHRAGKVGIISRSGTLTYEAVWQLTRLGLGQSTVVGIGGDPILGTGFQEILGRMLEDPGTEAVVLIGEIGGSAEEAAAQFYRERGNSKPVFAFVAGRTAPPGKRMGHAGAIVEGGTGTAESKREAFRKAGICVIDSPAEIGQTVFESLSPTRKQDALT